MKKKPNSVRIVDLFCGCGGLSLGFDLYNKNLKYKNVMSLDNDATAIKCYNSNFKSRLGYLKNARLCDLTWFNHESEIILYYLIHISLYENDRQLISHLDDLQISLFLNELKLIDDNFINALLKLSTSQDYIDSIKKVDKKVFQYKITKSFLGKLYISSLKKPGLKSIIWGEEYEVINTNKNLFEFKSNDRLISQEIFDNYEWKTIKSKINEEWEQEISKLYHALQKEKSKANINLTTSIQTLVDFITSPVGTKIKKLWIDWKSRRDSIRAFFCLSKKEELLEIYFAKYQVQVVLGGPPCKGFSRIGRPVIENLKNQGLHTWACNEYGDERNALLHKYVLFLSALKPKIFIFENVYNFKSVLTTSSGKLNAPDILASSIKDLSEDNLHFDIKAITLNTKSFGIPQDRERYIMVGFNLEKIKPDISTSFFDLVTYTDEVPLQIALQGLGEAGMFDFNDKSKSSYKTNYQSQAYTLFDKNMPMAYQKYIKWIRQSKSNKTISPIKTDAHIYRKLRDDDLALLEKFAPGQRWMDYKIKKSQTLNDLQLSLRKIFQYVKQHNNEDLPSKQQIKELLEKVNDSFFLRILLEEVYQPNSDHSEHHLLKNGYLSKGSGNHGDWFARLSATKPCKTIVAHIGKDTYGFFHPYENRALTIRETARVQTFPDFFQFGTVGVVDGYAMIGNAVPPLLSHIFASKLASMHEEFSIFDLEQKQIDKNTIEQNSNQLKLDIISG